MYWHHVGKLGELPADVVQCSFDRRSGRNPRRDRQYAVAPQPVGAGRLGEMSFELLLHRLDAGLHLAPHGLGELAKDLGSHHVSAVHGRHAEAERRLGDGAMFWPAALLMQRLDRIVLACEVLLVDGDAPGTVFLVLECGRQRDGELAHGLRHGAAQLLR